MNSRQYALEWLNRGAYETALTAFEKLVEAAPDDFYLHRLLVFAAFKADDLRWERCNGFYERTFNSPRDRWLKQYIDALQQYYDAQYKSGIERLYGLLTEIDNASVWHAMGECLKMQDAEPESCKAFQEALTRDPLYLPAVAAMAELFFEEGRFDRLEQYWEIIKTSDKALGTEYYQGGRMVERIRSLAECAATVRNALLKLYAENSEVQLLSVWQQWLRYPDNIPLLYILIYLFDRAGCSRTAVVVLKQHPTIARGALQYGLALISLYGNMLSETNDHLIEALAAHLEHPLCLLSLAELYLKQDMQDVACSMFRKVYELQHWCLPARIGLAEGAIRNEDWPKVIEYADVSKEDIGLALLYVPNAKAQWIKLERLALKSLVHMGHIEAAVERSENVATEIRDDPELAVERAIIMARAKHTKEARDIIETIADQLPDGLDCSYEDLILLSCSPGPNKRGYGVTLVRVFACLEKGKKQKALSILQRLAHQYPDRSSIHCIIGMYYHFSTKQDIEADEAFRKSVCVSQPQEKAIRTCVITFAERGDMASLIWLANKVPTSSFVMKVILITETDEYLTERKHIARKLLELNPECSEAIAFLMQHKSADDQPLYPPISHRVFYLDPCHFTAHFNFAISLIPVDGFLHVSEIMEKLFKRGGRDDAMLLRYAIGFAI